LCKPNLVPVPDVQLFQQPLLQLLVLLINVSPGPEARVPAHAPKAGPRWVTRTEAAPQVFFWGWPFPPPAGARARSRPAERHPQATHSSSISESGSMSLAFQRCRCLQTRSPSGLHRWHPSPHSRAELALAAERSSCSSCGRCHLFPNPLVIRRGQVLLTSGGF